MKKVSNIIKHPTISRQTASKKLKAETIIKSATGQNFKQVLIIGITGKGELKVNSTCGKICQSMAMLDLAKCAYLENYNPHQIITGKYDL
jgi:hypothetical protein